MIPEEISNAELAARAGVSVSTVCRYRSGRIPALPIARRLAAALGCDLNQIALKKGRQPGRPDTARAPFSKSRKSSKRTKVQ